MKPGEIILNDNLSEIIEYNSPTTPIKAAMAKLYDFPNGITPWHWHKELECTVALKGSLTYLVNDQTYLLKEGDAIIVNSNRLHSCTPVGDSVEVSEHPWQAPPENDCTYSVLLLQPDTLRFNLKTAEKYINPLLFDYNSNVFFLDHSENWHQEAIDSISEIHDAVYYKRPFFELTSQSKFFQLWRIIFENTIAKDGADMIETDPLSPLKKMISYIQEHYQDTITLNDIAEVGTMCQSKCCRLFRDNLRQSPIEFLQQYRIQRGMYLLEHSQLSITEIALECGFHGASYFTESFRKINGITPKDYRKEAKATSK